MWYQDGIGRGWSWALWWGGGWGGDDDLDHFGLKFVHHSDPHFDSSLTCSQTPLPMNHSTSRHLDLMMQIRIEWFVIAVCLMNFDVVDDVGGNNFGWGRIEQNDPHHDNHPHHDQNGQKHPPFSPFQPSPAPQFPDRFHPLRIYHWLNGQYWKVGWWCRNGDVGGGYGMTALADPNPDQDLNPVCQLHPCAAPSWLSLRCVALGAGSGDGGVGVDIDQFGHFDHPHHPLCF